MESKGSVKEGNGRKEKKKERKEMLWLKGLKCREMVNEVCDRRGTSWKWERNEKAMVKNKKRKTVCVMNYICVLNMCGVDVFDVETIDNTGSSMGYRKWRVCSCARRSH